MCLYVLHGGLHLAQRHVARKHVVKRTDLLRRPCEEQDQDVFHSTLCIA